MFTLLSRALQTILIYPIRKCNFVNMSSTGYSSNGDLWKYIYIGCPDLPVYLKRTRQSEIENESSRVGVSTFFKTGSILLFPNNEQCDNSTKFYLHSACESYELYRKLNLQKSLSVAHSLMFTSFSENENCLKHGVFVNCLSGKEENELKDIVMKQCKENPNIRIYELVANVKSNCLTLKKVPDDVESIGDGDEERTFELVDRKDLQRDIEGNVPIYESPIFRQQNLTPVYHDFLRSKSILQMLKSTTEVEELLKIADHHVIQSKVTEAEQDLKFPFIVVEGMDATGKTTLTETIEKKMGAARYFTPPPQILQLRSHFDQYPEIVRRAYYSVGNYIVAMDIIKTCQTRPVIMDRFWHSTAAYGIANESSSGDLPRADHSVYTWPSDLLKPSLVLFLSVSEEVRQQRMAGRRLVETFEEKSLDRDQLFRQRLCDAYRLMSNPSVVEIDASGTIEEVRDAAIDVLQKRGISLQSEPK
ncbi:UMP-CMP kinase 2, mitochondrial-like [Mya arenaria]|uniref:UMP-CMP kinase 2, mitochondrial-like n=1 Tax=Mya arenaria TaxID=6604 RepID=UPI0022E969DB|nr:UMP-CMP kinase 2, mitochondrial-like [Mya arenaria]